MPATLWRLVPTFLRRCYLCGARGYRYDPWYAEWCRPYYPLCRKCFEELT